LKISYITIVPVIITIITVPSLSAWAMPDMSSQDLYKQSDMVFYGQVISKQAGPNSDYYQIKVITYYKNPQISDSITAAGHKPEGGHMTYPQFEAGDKVIFYMTKIDGINTISPYSQKAGEACDVHSFLGPEYFGTPELYRGGYASNPRLLDVNGNAIVGMVLTNQEVVLRYDDVWNTYPEERTIPVKISIQNKDNGHYLFNMTQNLQVQACSFAGNLKWNFVPTEIGNYVAKIGIDNKTKIGYGFSVTFDATKLQIISSPLKQFKSGISAPSVKCKEGLQLIIKNKNNTPACVTPQTAKKLDQRNWGTYVTVNSQEAATLIDNKSNLSTECETKFTPKAFEHIVFPNGTSYTINYIPVYLMKPNSTAKICTNNWRTIPEMNYSGKVLVGIGKSDSTTHDVTVTAYPQEITIDDTNKTIVYTITASKDANGFYRFSPMFSDCGGIPIAIGYNTTHSFDNDFPWLWETPPCPLSPASTEITGLTGFDIAYITKEYH
jgi:hypothetical protein